MEACCTLLTHRSEIIVIIIINVLESINKVLSALK